VVEFPAWEDIPNAGGTAHWAFDLGTGLTRGATLNCVVEYDNTGAATP